MYFTIFDITLSDKNNFKHSRWDVISAGSTFTSGVPINWNWLKGLGVSFHLNKSTLLLSSLSELSTCALSSEESFVSFCGFLFLDSSWVWGTLEKLQPPQVCAPPLVRIRLAGIGDTGVWNSWRGLLGCSGVDALAWMMLSSILLDLLAGGCGAGGLYVSTPSSRLHRLMIDD